MNKAIKIVLAIIALISACGFYFIFSYYRGINYPISKTGQEKIFIVSKGEGVNDISENLSDAGLIRSMNYFEIYIWRQNLEKKLQAGQYVLSPKLSIKEIAGILAGGKILSKEIDIKIIEGWRVKDIVSYLKEKELVKEEDFINAAKNNELRIRNYEFLNKLPAGKSLEGFLFPDTYRVFKDSSAIDVIGKMLDNFGSKLTGKMRDDIGKNEKTIYEIVIMASIVEKEAKKPEDMEIISGIFWNRIKTGQALQSDATLSYVLNDKIDAHTLEDLKIDSPYNSYKYKGLPPGPICNPGLNAIKAAIYPKKTDYNFFLTKPDTGEAIFSKTYAEHLKNKNKFLK